MYCPKCGAVLEEDSKFCVNCGVRLDDITGTSCNNSAQEDKNCDRKKLESDLAERNSKKAHKNLPGLIVGTFLIVIGILRIVNAGTSISATSFGGDFYTYTYQGIVAISQILASIEQSLGWLIAAVGVAIDVLSVKR